MAGSVLPLLPIRRVLLPGTQASLPCTRRDLEGGDEVVTILEQPTAEPRAPHRVGTLARVEGVHRIGPGACLVRLAGRWLVRLRGLEPRGEAEWARVDPVPEPGSDPGGLIDQAQLGLRRYLALRAEMGESAGCCVELSRDPVAASHEVASCLRVSWPEVQDILEAGDAVARLRRAQGVLDRETELLRRLLGREGG